MVDVSVVRRKLRKLEEYVDQLSRLQPESFEAYKASVLHRRAIERLLQLLVEVASDINTHVLVSLGSPPPDDYYDGFIRMGASGVIPQELARRLAPSAGARNILVLEYEVIDDRIVYESVPHALTDFRAYGRALLEYLERRERPNE